MEGTKGTRKIESLKFLGDNIKIITINHIGFFFHLFWWVGEGCTCMCVPVHVKTRGQPQVVCSLSTVHFSIEMGHSLVLSSLRVGWLTSCMQGNHFLTEALPSCFSLFIKIFFECVTLNLGCF